MKADKKFFRAAAVALTCIGASTAPAWAQFPDKPIELVLPFPPGGAADSIGRLLAQQMEAKLGQRIIVNNKPGGGTAIGAQAVANAKPDGYTLLLSSNSTFTLNPAIQAKLAYDPVNGFEPIGLLGTIPLVAVTQASAPFNSIQQLVAAAKAQPDKLTYASFGNGTVSHFAGEMLNAAAGIKLPHVSYKGSAPAMTDLIGGQVPLLFDTVVAAVPQIKSGKIKPLAVTTTKRSALLPDVPTMAESGYPGYEMSSWLALVAPKGIPPANKARLEQVLASMMESRETLEKLRALGVEPAYATVSDWPARISKEVAQLREVASRAKITAD